MKDFTERASEPVALAATLGNQVSELVALAAIVPVLDIQPPCLRGFAGNFVTVSGRPVITLAALEGI